MNRTLQRLKWEHLFSREILVLRVKMSICTEKPGCLKDSSSIQSDP